MSDHSITTQPDTGSALPIRWWQAVLLLCLFVSATGLGIYWGQTHIVAGIENGFLEVDAEHLDFGEVWVQDKFQWTLPITNTSSEPVEVLEFRTSCNCASIEPTSLVIAPGETADVHLTLDLTTRNPEEAAKESRPFSVRIAPLINSGLAQYEGWNILGQVRRAILFDPPVVSFPEGSLVRTAEFDGKTVQVNSFLPLKSLIARCDAALAIVEVQADDDGSAYRVKIFPSGRLPTGRTDFSVMLHAVTEQGDVLPAVALPVQAVMVDDVYALPEVIAAGRYSVGEQVRDTVALRSRLGNPFVVSEVRVDDECVRVVRMDTQDTYELIVDVTEQGLQSAQIVFAIEQEQGIKYDVTVKTFWYGRAVTTKPPARGNVDGAD